MWATLAPGTAGTVQTVTVMRRLVEQGGSDVEIRRLAFELLSGCPPTLDARLSRLFRYAADRVRFVRDPKGTELLQGAWVTARRLQGDCDDKSILLASLIRAARLPVSLAFRVIGADRRRPDRFTHVYVVARAHGRCIALDPTRYGTPFGWQFPRPTITREFAI